MKSEKEKFYVTTAIHYVNDLPHIGHLYENVVADVIARYRRMQERDVFFLTGTDEHGQKIERSAEKQGIAPIELADRVVENHHALWKKLAISHDDFIRTTESRHRLGVYELIRRIQETNPDDLYLGEHSGWYCATEETFYPESQVENGRCEEGHPVEMTTERNYFFRLSKYEKPLLEFYEANPQFVQPKSRFNEVISFVRSGLRDLSVSRTSIRWGIPFPGNPEHVIYVWMDALTNYISALGFGSDDDARMRRYWPADVHLIGKDIVRFHAVYWPAFLMAAGIELPKTILTHGWWLRDNQKISKSTGNVVRPDYIIDEFGADPLRYYLLREMTFGHDANYSDESFLQRFNADLANDLGNTLSRILKMTESYFDGKTPPVPCNDNDLRTAAEEVIPQYKGAMDQYAFQRALEAAWKLIVATNGYLVAREPWKHYKEKGADAALSRILWNALEAMRIVWTMLAPFMPKLAPEALRRLGADAGDLRVEKVRWGVLLNGAPIDAAEAIFPRIDTDAYLERIRDEQKDKTTMSEEKKSEEANEPKETAAAAAPPQESTEAQPPDEARISINEFMKVKLRTAKVLEAKRVPKSNKLLELRVTTGDAERTVVAGIGKAYEPESLVGKNVVIVANLEPARLMGVESNGMVLAASIDGSPSLLAVADDVPPGTEVR